MRRRSASAVLAFFFALSPAVVFGTAYSPLTYKFTVWQGGRTVNLCTQAGIIDVAKNRSEAQSRRSTGPNCSGSLTNVPSGYLAVSVAGYRNGAYCGDSGNYYSNQAYSRWWVTWQACSNPSGSQTFYTDARGAIYNDGSGGGAVGYIWKHTISPSQNY